MKLSALLLLPLLAALPTAGRADTPAADARETPPPPLPPRRITLPAPVEKRLANGLRVIVVPRRGTGLISVALTVKGAGGASDPENRAGLASFTAELLTKGTTTRSATEVARQVEELGGALSADAGWDSSTLSLSVLGANIQPAMDILTDVALHPAFRADEVIRLRAQTLDNLHIDLDDPGSLAHLVAGRVVFGKMPYAHALGGTLRSVPNLQRMDVAAFHQKRYLARNAALVFGGNITPEAAFALAEKAFGGWGEPAKKTEPAFVAIAFLKPRLSGRIVVIDKPDAGQAAVLVTRIAIQRSSPYYYPLLVANGVLGDGYSSRLNREVRVKRGLAYNAGSYVVARRWNGPFIAEAQTKNESAAEVAWVMRAEMKRLTREAAPPAELTTRKAALSGDYARSLESGAGLVGRASSLAALDIPLSGLAAYPTQVQSVSADAARQAAARYLSPSEASIVIVGSAKRFLPDLKKRFVGVMPITVIPAAKLDLNRADLGAKL